MGKKNEAGYSQGFQILLYDTSPPPPPSQTPEFISLHQESMILMENFFGFQAKVRIYVTTGDSLYCLSGY